MNEDKSKIVHFRRSSDDLTDHSFVYGDTTLAIVNMYRYLGLDLYETLDFAETVKALSKSASRALGVVVNKYFTYDGLDYRTYSKLYESMVVPIMDYACEIWATRKRDCCDVVQHRAMRTFLGVGKCAPLPMLYGDMSWIPSHVRQQTAMLRLWIRLIRMPPTRLARQVFDWDFSHTRKGTWCHDVKQMFVAHGMADIYHSRSSRPELPVIHERNITRS